MREKYFTKKDQTEIMNYKLRKKLVKEEAWRRSYRCRKYLQQNKFLISNFRSVNTHFILNLYIITISTYFIA